MIFYAYFFCCLSQNNYLCALIFSHLLNMQSHPTWVRGLKLCWLTAACNSTLSHPTWVRGLKLVIGYRHRNTLGRTLRGCVD